MSEVLAIYNIELDQTDYNGTTHWLVFACIDNMVQTLAPCYNPPELSHPGEYGPGNCSAMLSLIEGELPPDDPQELRKYIQDWDLDWTLDE